MTDLVVGIAGRAGSGKDTLAAEIRKQLARRGVQAACLAFADPVKAVYKVLFDGDPYTEDRELKERTIIPYSGGRTMRQLLRIIGTEWGRALYPKIWLIHMVRRIRVLAKSRRAAIITDIRFPDEMLLGHQLNAVLLDVVRFEPKAPSLMARIWRRITFRSMHPSEAVKYRKMNEKLGVITVRNEGSKQDLKREAARLVEEVILPKFRSLRGL